MVFCLKLNMNNTQNCLIFVKIVIQIIVKTKVNMWKKKEILPQKVFQPIVLKAIKLQTHINLEAVD